MQFLGMLVDLRHSYLPGPGVNSDELFILFIPYGSLSLKSVENLRALFPFVKYNVEWSAGPGLKLALVDLGACDIMILMIFGTSYT